MNRILELKLIFRLNELLNQNKKHNPGYVLLENEEYYLSMLIDINKYNDQLKFLFVRKNKDKSLYVLQVTNICSNISTQNIINHINDKYSDLLFKEMFEINDTKCSRIDFEKYYNDFFKHKKQLQSKTPLSFDDVLSSTTKPISSYEKESSSLTKHLIEPRNEKERRQAIIERQIFHNPKMWTFKA